MRTRPARNVSAAGEKTRRMRTLHFAITPREAKSNRVSLRGLGADVSAARTSGQRSTSRRRPHRTPPSPPDAAVVKEPLLRPLPGEFRGLRNSTLAGVFPILAQTPPEKAWRGLRSADSSSRLSLPSLAYRHLFVEADVILTSLHLCMIMLPCLEMWFWVHPT